MEFKNKLKEIRNRKGISQQQLADELNISRSVVAKWETGLALPSDENLELLSKYFEVPKEELIDNYKTEKVLVNKSQSISKLKKIIIALVSVIIIISAICVFIFIKSRPETLLDEIDKLGANFELSLINNKTGERYVFDKYVDEDVYQDVLKLAKRVEYKKVKEALEDEIYTACFKGNIEIKLNKSFISINNEKQYFEEYETKGLVEEIINLLIMNITDFIFEYNPETNSYILKGSKDKEIMYLVIPATHKKLPVTEIADNAFANYENLEQVSFSSNIKKIGKYAFLNCKKIKTMLIPDTVDEIEEYILEGCTSLENLTIPFIGHDLWSIDNNILGYFFGTNNHELQKNYVPLTLKEIKITKEDVIEENAFYYCLNIKKITLGKSVSFIGKKAFCCCLSLETLILEAETKLRGIDYFAFENVDLTELYYGSNIYDWIKIKFYSSTSSPVNRLSNSSRKQKCHVYMTNDLTNYYEVTRIDIPSNTFEVGNYQFSGFDFVTEIRFEEYDTVTKIGEGAFEGCPIKKIDLPHSVKEIGHYAFNYCKELREIYIPQSCKKIGLYAFYECENLSFVYIPEGVETIFQYSFAYCTSLQEITIPNSVTDFGWDVLKGSNSLKKVTIPYIPQKTNIEDDNLVYRNHFGVLFGSSTYEDNDMWVPKSLKEVVITKENLITSYAFYNCYSIEKLYLPSTVQIINGHAFENCINMTIYCEVDAQPEGWNENWNYTNCDVVWNYKFDEESVF